MGMRSDRAGFALPMAILVIGFITAGVVAAFTRATAEVRLVDNQRTQTKAFAVAQAGLDRYMARGKTTPTDTTIVLTDGSARVRATLIRPSMTRLDTAIWLIRSDAVTLGGSAVPAGRRTVAQFAYRVRGAMQVLSTWTTLSGLVKAGSSGIISGDDVCTTDTLAGVALPDSTYTQNGAGNVIYGNPPVHQMGTQTDMADSIKIDWAGISDPTAPMIPPDYLVCMPGTAGYDSRWAPCTGWPTVGKFASDTTFWPIIIVNGTFGPLPEKGRGTLIVTGDLIFGGFDDWEGIILVGKRIIDNGSGYIAGAVVTGLDVMKGINVGQSSKALGTKDYFYDSCAVERAASNQAKLVQVPNAWVDNWTAW